MLLKNITSHPNVCGYDFLTTISFSKMRYYGICKYDESYFLVLEYFSHGCLEDVVKTHSFTTSEKVHFCMELTRGIWHLHASEVLHGDLALRNVLIDIDKKPMRAVLTDFGQSCNFEMTSF